MKKLPRVLVVEDEPAIAELIAVNLRHNGFAPTVVFDGESARREIDAVLPDVILLDWMLPGESGAALARTWRRQERTVDVHVKRLRESLGDAAGMVETVRGAGYRLTSRVAVGQGSGDSAA